jgi:hypothetical protein
MALMTNETPQIELVFSDEFKTRLRTLIKRYRSILLVIIYSKSDQDDIPANQIREIIDGV